MKKTNIIILIVLVVVLAGAVLYFSGSWPFKPTGENVEGEVLDTICKSIETTENATENYTIKTEVCKTGIEVIDSEVAAWINDRVIYTIENAEKLNEIESAAKPEFLVISEVFSHSDAVKSLKLSAYEYQGGAHGMTNYMTWVFNKETDEVFDFESFFRQYRNPLQTIYPVVKEKLMAKDENMDEDWVDRGTGYQNFENYKNFVLDGNDLVLIFPAYQVGPYALGPQTVVIPFSELSTIMKPEFFEPAAECKASTMDECPTGCIVCPLCEECSYMGCDLAEFCQSIGFDTDWYDSIKIQDEIAE